MNAQAHRMSEAEWMAQVIELARLLHWRVAHFRPGRTEKGWRTAVQGDGKGWPDFVLVRERIIFAELKAGAGRLAPAQEEWFNRLTAAGAEVYVWRPDDWHDVVRTLRMRLPAA